MQPKLIAASIAAAFSVLAAPAHAGPLDRDEVKALAYVSLPFGGLGRQQQAPMLGFAVNHIQREHGDGFSYHPMQFQHSLMNTGRSLLDVRFNAQTQIWDRFRIGGVDALTYSTRMKADGTTETMATLAEVPTWAIVAGVVVGAAVIHDATEKKGTEAKCPPGQIYSPVGPFGPGCY